MIQLIARFSPIGCLLSGLVLWAATVPVSASATGFDVPAFDGEGAGDAMDDAVRSMLSGRDGENAAKGADSAFGFASAAPEGGDAGASSPFEAINPVTASIRPEPWRQVRIEQHFSIRITPGAPVMPPDMLEELEQGDAPPNYAERDVGRCVAIGSIAAVQGGEGNRLLLFMRDQHIISAFLEKACRAHDFYMGFYVERHGDGMLCVDRDRLQARSGASCHIKRLRALVAMPNRRFP